MIKLDIFLKKGKNMLSFLLSLLPFVAISTQKYKKNENDNKKK